MAHLIDFSKGKAAFVAFQQPAWHNLGKVFDRRVTLNEALTEGGLDYQVEKYPNIHRLPDGSDIVSKDSFFTMRTDVNKVLGSKLGKDYTVYQNSDALNLVDEMMQTGKVAIESAGAVDEGRKMFVCLKLNKGISVGAGDDVNSYVLLCNSHDGSIAITALPTNVRVVCNNTLTAALRNKGGHRILHFQNAQTRVKEAFKIMGLLEDSAMQSEDVYNKMRETKISKQEFFDYVGNIFMTSEEIKDLQMGKAIKELVSARKMNTIESVLEFSNTGIGQNLALDGNDLNMWWAYNAVTGIQTGKKYSSADDRFNSLVFGGAATTCKKAFDLATVPASIQPLRRKGIDMSGINFN